MRKGRREGIMIWASELSIKAGIQRECVNRIVAAIDKATPLADAHKTRRAGGMDYALSNEDLRIIRELTSSIFAHQERTKQTDSKVEEMYRRVCARPGGWHLKLKEYPIALVDIYGEFGVKYPFPQWKRYVMARYGVTDYVLGSNNIKHYGKNIQSCSTPFVTKEKGLEIVKGLVK
jgi:hypothetical protein